MHGKLLKPRQSFRITLYFHPFPPEVCPTARLPQFVNLVCCIFQLVVPWCYIGEFPYPSLNPTTPPYSAVTIVTLQDSTQPCYRVPCTNLKPNLRVCKRNFCVTVLQGQGAYENGTLFLIWNWKFSLAGSNVDGYKPGNVGIMQHWDAFGQTSLQWTSKTYYILRVCDCSLTYWLHGAESFLRS